MAQRTPPAGRLFRLLPGLGLWLVSAPARAEYALAFQRPVTPVARRLLELHNLVLAACLVIFAVVSGFVCYSIVVHRKSRGCKAAKFHDHTALEAAWSAMPFLLLAGMAIPATATLLEMADAGRPDLTIRITGYQWNWRYRYLDQDIGFFSALATPREQIEGGAPKGEHYLLEADRPVVIPVDKQVRLLITGNDVIHAWWVPQLGVKKDAIPGFLNEAWVRVDEPGVYRGQCAELCGRDHGFMPIVVQAVSQEEFDKWVSLQKDSAAAAAR